MLECIGAIFAFLLLVVTVAYLIYKENYTDDPPQWVPITGCRRYYRIEADAWELLKSLIKERNAEVHRLRHIVDMYATGCEPCAVDNEEKE